VLSVVEMVSQEDSPRKTIGRALAEAQRNLAEGHRRGGGVERDAGVSERAAAAFAVGAEKEARRRPPALDQERGFAPVDRLETGRQRHRRGRHGQEVRRVSPARHEAHAGAADVPG